MPAAPPPSSYPPTPPSRLVRPPAPSPDFSAQQTTSHEPPSTPASVRATVDYDSDDDDDDELVYATTKSVRGRGRDSISQLLPEDDLRELATPATSRSWRESYNNFMELNSGFLLIVLSQAAFAIVNCLVKLLEAGVPVPTWQIVWVRMTVTWIGAIGFMFYRGIPHPLLGPPGVRMILTVRGLTGFWGLFGVYFSLQYLSLSDSTALTFFAPILCGILAALVLHEGYSRTEGTVGVISLLGVLLVAKPSFLFPASARGIETGPDGSVVTSRQRTLAILVALGGCFGAAGAYVCIRSIGKRAHALHIIAFFSLYCVIVSSIYPMVVHDPPVFILSFRFFGLLLPIGIFGFIAQGLLTLGLQREKAGRGSLAVYSHIIFALILERLVFSKLPDAWSIAGASLIVAGGIYVALEKGRQSAEAALAERTRSPESKAETGEVDEESSAL